MTDLHKTSRHASNSSADTAASISAVLAAKAERVPVAAVDVETDIGPRKTNEDRFSVVMDLSSELEARGPPQALFAVFDGHGGEAAADFCGDNFAAIVARQEMLESDPREAICRALTEVEEEFVSNDDTAAHRTGTTAAVALLRAKTLHCAWVGDSEAWLFKSGGTACKIMDPHRPLRPDERRRVERTGGRVTKEDIPPHIDFRKRQKLGRVNNSLAVSRALGDMRYKDWVISTPECTETPIDGTEEFLVVASDGLWDVMEPKDVRSIVRKYVASHKGNLDPTRGLASHLISKVQAKGAVDNITAVVVLFPKAAPELYKATLEAEGQQFCMSDLTNDRSFRRRKGFIPRMLAKIAPV